MADIDKRRLTTELQGLPSAICKELSDHVHRCLKKAGFYYRLFSRAKTVDSAFEKITAKKYCETKKMQDLFGLRIAHYFREDIEICCNIIENKFDVVDISRDEETPENFKPMKLNYVCRLPTEIAELLNDSLWELPIDKTFEIQIRTVFSEGWHEVEHELRYKTKWEWEGHPNLSRNLNGIYATLETCDWAIGNLFNELAYRKYKEKNWEAMLRNQLKIHIDNIPMSGEMKNQLDKDANLTKELFRINRKKFLLKLSDSKLGDIPKTFDNLIWIANALYVKNEFLINSIPPLLNKLVQEASSDSEI